MSRAEADKLIAEARDHAARGSMRLAWQRCNDAADLGRELGDAATIAHAAIAISGPDLLPTVDAAARRSMCVEAIALLGDTDPELSAMVEAQLKAISSPWATPATSPGQAPDAGETQRRYLSLQAAHADALGPHGVGRRLAVADELIELGVTSGQAEILAWGQMWRLDALGQLGLRVEWNATFVDLTAAATRVDAPVWAWRLATIRACLAIDEHRLDDARELAAAASDAARRAEVPDGAFVDLILQTVLAQRSGEGLEQVEADVRRAIDGMPFLAQGWRAMLLAQMKRTDEAVSIWRSLAPHVGEVPRGAVEWLVIQADHAMLAMLAGDRASAATLLDLLSPFAHHQVRPSAMAPSSGPVALVLGRLAAFLGDDRADGWLREAVTRAESVLASWPADQARAALADLDRPFSPLSRREGQIARLVARSMTNRQIADELVVSERTVEQHVRSILRKLGVANRTGVAAWVTGQSPN